MEASLASTSNRQATALAESQLIYSAPCFLASGATPGIQAAQSDTPIFDMHTGDLEWRRRRAETARELNAVVPDRDLSGIKVDVDEVTAAHCY